MFHFSLRAMAGAVTLIALACAALVYASPWIASLAWTATVLGLTLATVVAVLSSSPRRGFWTGLAIVGWIYAFVTVSPMLGDLHSSLFTTALLQRAAAAMPQAATVAMARPPVYTPTTSYVVGPAIAASTPVYAPSPTSMPTQPGFGPEDEYGDAPATSSMPRYARALPPAAVPQPAAPLPPAPPSTAIYPVTTYAPGQSYYAPASAIDASRFTESFIQIGEALWVLVFALAGGLLGQCLVTRQARAEAPATA